MSLLSVISGKSTHCGYRGPTADLNYSANDAPLGRRVRGCGEENVLGGSCARLRVSSALASRRPAQVFAHPRTSFIQRGGRLRRLHFLSAGILGAVQVSPHRSAPPSPGMRNWN